jgi:hypothetical protein
MFCRVALASLISFASGCSIVDTKYYDRLVHNGSGGGMDDDAGADSDAQVDPDAAPSG